MREHITTLSDYFARPADVATHLQTQFGLELVQVIGDRSSQEHVARVARPGRHLEDGPGTGKQEPR